MHREVVFSEGGRLQGEWQSLNYEHEWASEHMYHPRCRLMFDDTGADGKAVMCRTKDYKYVYRLYETDELYALCDDPTETRNRIHDPSCTHVVREMRDRMLQWLVATGDVVPFDQDRRTPGAVRGLA